MRRLRLPLIAALTLSSGCVNFAARRDLTLDAEMKSGLVVASFTQPPHFPVLKWSYRIVGSKQGRMISTTRSFGNGVIDAGDAILYPFLAPEGEYEFYAWTQPESGYYWHSKTPFSVRFRVTRGKATYVGNLALLVRGLSSFSLEARDRRDTEIPLFLASYPNIREHDVEVAIMAGEGIGGPGTAPGGKVDPKYRAPRGPAVANAYVATTTVEATGAIASATVVHPGAQSAADAEKAAEKEAALQRAFGSDNKHSLGKTVGGIESEASSSGPRAEFLRVLGAEAPGRTRFVPSIEGYVQTGLVAELKAMGIAIGPGRAALRGEIQDAALDLSGWGYGATVTIRYQVSDAAGTPLYTAVKTAATSADERAESEAAAFAVALRKSAEALASDPAFAKSVR